MLDITKLSFNEMDNTETPLQFFFNYNVTDAEKQDFISDISHDEKCTNIEVCLDMYSNDDWKLEAIIDYESGKQEWIDINEAFHSATEYLEIIHNTKTERAEEAYANYEYLRNYKEVMLNES
jgi:hypothetical protein